MNIVKELTPELANKIYNSFKMKQLGDRISRERTLHNLKQVKAEIGKLKKKLGFQNDVTQLAIKNIIEIIDKKIAKIK